MLSILMSCTTPKKTPVVATAKSVCHCGPVFTEASSGCGVWSDSQSAFSKPTLHQQTQQDCSKSTCEGLGQQHCSRILIWPARAEKIQFNQPALDKPCYCDRVVVSEGDRNLIACAAWLPGQTDLLEYRLTSDCGPTTCEKQPFELAAKHCQSGFVSFYEANFSSTDQEKAP